MLTDSLSRAWRNAAMLLLVAAAVVLHASALDGWWLYDDPQLLLHALNVPNVSTFFVPESYKLLATHTFTPLLPLSFDLDLALFGLRPSFFYGHQLLALTVSALLVFHLLLRHVRLPYAFGAALFIVASWPSVYAVRTLMIRHYVDGLLLALLAILCFRGKGKMSAVVAALLYLAAMLAKEVYVPLPLFLFADRVAAGDDRREILRRLVPAAVAGMAFAVWRTLMLGSGGGYGGAVSARDLLRLPQTIAFQIGGGNLALPLAFFAIFAVAIVLAVRRRPKRLLFGVAAVAAAVLPVAPLAAMFEWRFVFVITVVLTVILALALDAGFGASRLGLIAMALLCTLAVISARPAAKRYDAQNRPSRLEGAYVWSSPPDAPMLIAGSTPWYLQGVVDLRRRFRGTASPSFAASTDALLFVDRADAVQFDTATNRLTPLSAQERVALLRTRTQHDDSIDLSVELSRRNDALRWTLSSARAVSWKLITVPSYASYDVPPSGQRRIPRNRERQYFRIRGVDAAGRWRATPVLPLPFEGETARWKGER